MQPPHACRYLSAKDFPGGTPAWAPSRDEQVGATARFDELFRIYLRDMGVETELLDIVDKTSDVRRRIELPPSEWTRLRIVTETSL